MADAKQAVDFVMRQEDFTLSGVITNRVTDRGGCTRFGLTQRWHPDLTAKDFFAFDTVDGKQVPKLATAEAQALAETAYEAQYVGSLQLTAFSYQAVAIALLSFAVLEGSTEAAAMLQKAIVAVTPPPKPVKTWDNKPAPPVLAVDGVIGAKTVALANSADAGSLRNMLVSFGEAYFQHVVSVIPSQAANLKGWINRAEALRAIAIPAPVAPATPATTAAVAEAS